MLSLAVAVFGAVAWFTDGAGAARETAEARCLGLWPEIEVAADLAGISPERMAGLLMHESKCLPVEGKRANVTGTGQVAWYWWGPLLAPEGWTDHELLDPVWGTIAAGRVLGAIQGRWSGLPGWRVACTYNAGPAWLRKPPDKYGSCRYWRVVRRAERKISKARGRR